MSNNDEVMIDLETMGTRANAAIVAIGAVRFDREATTIDANKFYELVDLQSSLAAGLEVTGDTVMWWLQQSEEARAEFKKGGLPLFTAIQRLAEWISRVPNTKVWGNGAGFDNPILETAYSKLGLEAPWKFWNSRCYRTMKNEFPQVPMIKREGTYHCAVDDADTQATHLLDILSYKDELFRQKG